MKLRYLTLAALAAIPLLAAGEAQASHGEYCREFTKTIRIGGNIETGYGRACMMPDGSWQIVSTGGTLSPREIFPQEIHQRIVYRDYHYAPRPYYPSVNLWFGSSKHRHNPGHHYGHHKKDWHHKYKAHGPKHHGPHRGRH